MNLIGKEIIKKFEKTKRRKEQKKTFITGVKANTSKSIK